MVLLRANGGFTQRSDPYAEMQAQGKTAAVEATRYLLAALGMSAINRHHHVGVDMEM